MNTIKIIQHKCPETTYLNEWLQMGDFQKFLVALKHGEIPIHYIEDNSGSIVFLSSVLLPVKSLKGNWVEELLQWNFNPSESTWGYGMKGSRGRYVLFKPYSFEYPDIIQLAEPIITARYNSCSKDRTQYFEVNPKITHIHDLHWISNASAYCKPDNVGDIRDVIKVEANTNRRLVTIAEDILLKHLLLGNYVLARFFDVDRWVNEMPIPTKSGYDTIIWWHEENIHARLTPVHVRNPAGNAEVQRAFLRGFQLIHPPSNHKVRDALLKEQKRKYCPFIAFDWKNQRVAEVSCNPKQLGNYFVESTLPYETSPAFFKREVLRKYQDDTDKYTVKDRQIDCRSAWSLTFDINQEGQVHVYLIDLSYLPYTEQLYWRSFNEEPKGTISNRSYKTDFLGEWALESNPLKELKRILKDFPHAIVSGRKVEFWQQPGGADADLLERIHYMAGASQKEWETSIVELDKLVVEGFNVKELLRPTAQILGITQEKLVSISLLKAILEAKGIAPDLIIQIIVPLKQLQEIRSQVASHRKGTNAAKVIKNIKSQFKSFDNHYTDLVAQMLQSLSLLKDLIDQGHFNQP